jgi:quercetin dioxygenase-like cupin family protein
VDMSSANFATVGLSHFLPGGGAEMDAGLTEKIYVVLEGEITITLGDSSEYVLCKLDSCLIGPGEARAVRVDGNDVATILVVMPPPQPQP